LSASPAKLIFGNPIYGGLDLQGQIVTKFTSITNTSKALSAPIDASATGDFTVVGGGKQACTAQLAAKGKCVIGVKFQPSDFGPRSGILSIGGVHVATLSGNGAVGKIAIAGSLNFGKIKAGTSISKTLTITNKSPVSIEVSDIQVFNDTSDFSVDKKCEGALQAKAPCKITVTFTPTTAGKKSAMLRITHFAVGSHSLVNLSGTAR
jgi:hypothetical protein